MRKPWAAFERASSIEVATPFSFSERSEVRRSKIKSVAIIIPAFNEETRILSVLRAASESSLASEIIVISDGSYDETAKVARTVPGVRVYELPVNMGKGAAMAAGVRLTDARYLVFVDADLAGLTSHHIDKIILPLLDRRCDMCVGIFRGGKVWSDAAHTFTPYLSGQRAVRRELFEAVPFVGDLRLGVEYALNSEARRRRARVLRVVLEGVSNCHKEQKFGIVKGLAARTKMYKEIGEAMVKTRRRRKPPRYARRPWI